MPADSSPPMKIAVLLSGGGTTLVNLHEKIEARSLTATIELVIASRPCQGIERSQKLGYAPMVASRKQFTSDTAYSEHIFAMCQAAEVELVVLAGFLSKLVVPSAYIGRVMNIHPSLIPAFCGQGMYGHHVHQAVIERGCKVSGCTVHYCDNEYDHGPIILQRCVPVLDEDDADSLAARVFAAECELYPEAIRQFANNRI